MIINNKHIWNFYKTTKTNKWYKHRIGNRVFSSFLKNRSIFKTLKLQPLKYPQQTLDGSSEEVSYWKLKLNSQLFMGVQLQPTSLISHLTSHCLMTTRIKSLYVCGRKSISCHSAPIISLKQICSEAQLSISLLQSTILNQHLHRWDGNSDVIYSLERETILDVGGFFVN